MSARVSRAVLFAAVLVAGTVLMVLQSSCRTAGSDLPAYKDTFTCRWTDTAVKLDGTLDDPAWQKAEVIAPFWHLVFPRDGSGYKLAYDQTEVRMLWDEKNLYIGVKMEDKDLTAAAEKHDDQLWADGDVFEFFAKPSRDSYWYYEFHVNPKNTTLDLGFPRRGSTGWAVMSSYESDMKTAVKVNGTMNKFDDTDTGWTAEIVIPFSAFKAATGKNFPSAGDKWQFAPCRYNYSVHLPDNMFQAVELSSAARDLERMGFHNLENYLTLVFEK